MQEQASGKADTFLLSCIDPRLADDTTFYFSALGRTDRYSEMRIAGAALAVVDTNRPAWSAAVWENLAASRQLHGVRCVTFLNHRDCGAMRLWANRPLDATEELRLHTEVMNRAAEAVRARYPDMQVELKLMELDGSVRPLPCAACAPQPLRAEAVGGNPDGFAELVRTRRIGGRAAEPEAELALLTEGVTRYGLSARGAREVLTAAEAGSGSGRVGQRDVAAFLKSRRDRAGQVGSADIAQAGQLYRRLMGNGVSARDAGRRAAVIAEAEGLAPRPEGLPPFRSTRWFRRLSEPVRPR